MFCKHYGLAELTLEKEHKAGGRDKSLQHKEMLVPVPGLLHLIVDYRTADGDQENNRALNTNTNC